MTSRIFLLCFLVNVVYSNPADVEKPVASESGSTFAVSGLLDLKTKDEDHTCTMNLNACEIKIGGPGPKGETGPPGWKGDRGFEGRHGLPGYPGVKGDKGEPGLGAKGPKGETGSKGWDGIPGRPGMDGDKGMFGQPGEKGDRGEQGPQGDRGRDGLYGMKGDKGSDKGWPGPSGSMGMIGGEQGPKGNKGETGEFGANGVPGPPGLTGFKGSHGQMGPSGVPGLDAQCLTTCPERYYSTDEENYEGLLEIGTKERPSENACHVIRNSDNEIRDKIWVYPGLNKFEVKCKGPPTHHTCLIMKPVNTTSLDEMAFHTGKDKTGSFWLSNYKDSDSKTNKRFDLTQLYNSITKTQLTWLRNKMTQVTQTIRYHCKNSYVMEDSETALHLHSWNEVRIGPTPSGRSPMAYSVMPGAKDECTSDAPKNEWRYTDITVRGGTERLPIIDFYIRDNRKENQYFYLELLEVCFG